MLKQVIEQFDAWNIKNASIQFMKENKQEPGTKFGCMGTIASEPETTVTLKLNVTVSAHVSVQVLRDYFGLSNEDLKPGIYSYGSNSLGKDFVFTADVVDGFEDFKN
ncbi:hypothetical protein [Lysinibacillus sp. NPDC056232]|uniref:hypothetical protein n=1 Tax=Lysinibacillus sp. NPDC056232 TaxID=3345756 RepID=UPI0035D8AC89